MMFMVVCLLCVHMTLCQKYEATWQSLDTRPIPDWFKEAKLGIFVHWGVFSVPSIGTKGAEWFWRRTEEPGYDPMRQAVKKDYLHANYPKNFKYQDFAPEFKSELWKPKEWAKLFEQSGAKYVVLTTKHHDGYVMWPSPHSWNWNCNDTGPGRDILGELAYAVRTQTDLRFGVYNSLTEWYHPLRMSDREKRTSQFVDMKLIPEMKMLITHYKPDVIWSDGDGSENSDYWKSKEFLQWLYNESPVKDQIVANDRWGNDAKCQHGGVITCNDLYEPGEIITKPWESCVPIDGGSWGFRRNARADHYMDIKAIIKQLVTTISYGGNMLLNVAPSSDGMIPAIQEERLIQLGEWMAVNGEAVYGSAAWKKAQQDTHSQSVWYTKRGSLIYAFVMDWPKNNVLTLGSLAANPEVHITMLGYNGTALEHDTEKLQTTVKFPPLTIDQLPSLWAWVLKIENLSTI